GSWREVMSQRAAIRNHRLKSSLTASESRNNPPSSRHRRRTTTVGVNTKQLRINSLKSLPDGWAFREGTRPLSFAESPSKQKEQTNPTPGWSFSTAIWRSSFAGSHYSSASRKDMKEVLS